MLPGLTSAIMAGGPVGPVVIERTASTNSFSASASLATFTGVSIGPAAADRIVVVCVSAEESNATPLTCTIDYGTGDISMSSTSLSQVGSVRSRISYLAVPTGITATIKVDVSDSLATSTLRIAVYTVTAGAYLSGGTDTSLNMTSASPLTTGSVTIPEGGGFIASVTGASDTDAKTWANATEDLDLDGGTYRHTTATRTTAGTVTVTCTGTDIGEDGALAWVIFTPA